MATRRWSNSQGRYITVVTTERKRKSDLVRAALGVRGLTAQENYRDGTVLKVGGGTWEASLPYTLPGGGSPVVCGTIRGESFDDLLATIEDDTRFAHFVHTHHREYRNLAEALRSAQDELSYAKRGYGNAAAALVVGRLDAPTDDALLAKREDALAKAHGALSLAHEAHKRARAAFDGYMARLPQTGEAARAYLAALSPALTGKEA